MTREEQFKEVTEGLLELYLEKNARYKDSFARQFEKKGLPLSLMRIEDKFLRLEALVENPEDDGGDESIVDTLRDLANYTIMTLIALQEEQGGEGYATD